MREAVLVIEEYPQDEITMQVAPVDGAAYFDIAYRTVAWTPQAHGQLADDLAPYLRSWTFDQPATADGLRRIDPHLLLTIRALWAEGVAVVERPLGEVRSAGTPPTPAPSPVSSRRQKSPTGSSGRIPATPSSG